METKFCSKCGKPLVYEEESLFRTDDIYSVCFSKNNVITRSLDLCKECYDFLLKAKKPNFALLVERIFEILDIKPFEEFKLKRQDGSLLRGRMGRAVNDQLFRITADLRLQTFNTYNAYWENSGLLLENILMGRYFIVRRGECQDGN